MTARWESRISVIGQTITVDWGSGDAESDIDDGYYYVLDEYGVSTGVVTADTTIDVDDSTHPHTLHIGAVVDIIRPSSGLIYSGLTVTGANPAEIDVDSAVTLVANDIIVEQNDLLGHMVAIMMDEDLDIRLSMDRDTGVVSFVLASGTATVKWLSSAFFAGLFRFETDTTALSTTPAPGDYTHLGGFFPSKATVDDRPKRAKRIQEYGSDDGSRFGLTLATQRKHLATVRYRGGPRSLDWAEIYAFEDFYDLAYSLTEIRFYPDKDVVTPYVRRTNPYGWGQWVLESPKPWTPDGALSRSVYDNFTIKLQLAES